MALPTVLVLTGQRRLINGIVVASVPVLLLCLFLGEWQPQGQPLISAEPWQIGWGALAAGFTLTTCVAAHRGRLIDTSVLGKAIAGWFFACVLVGAVSASLNAVSMSWFALSFGVLSLAFAPLAAGPLALAWNRHR